MAKAPQASRLKANPLDWTLGGLPTMGGASPSAAPLAAAPAPASVGSTPTTPAPGKSAPATAPGKPPAAPSPIPPQPPGLGLAPAANGSPLEAAAQAAKRSPTPPKPAGITYRSLDGSGNNLSNTGLNALGADFSRLGPARFSDGISALRTDLPNARTISNLVVAGNGATPNKEGLSGMMYAWGQFIDHDINLTLSDGVNPIDIAVPSGDPVLSGSISMTRSVIDPLTGVAGKPATTINNVTGWLDGSMVYGSDATTAASLRDANGYLLTSAGNNLPIVNGAFVAGVFRVSENPSLTALQTLFLREHNRQVDKLKLAHPDWSGNQLYDQARAIVSAEIARITYNEFLPHLLGPNAIKAYQGYKPGVDARLSEEFAGAAFRFGHSIVSANLEKTDEQGNEIGTAVTLKEAFFQAPADFIANSGADGLLRHLSGDLSNALDVHIVDDLRNFLFGPAAGMDLAAINIQRGRDLGLGTLNETRRALGLKAYTSFEAISSDATTAAALKAAYGDVNKVELWIGGLAETHLAGAMVGQTFDLIISKQFEALRDGDRLWYQNQGFDAVTLKEIEATTLSSLILKDTNTQHIQADAFLYTERRSGLSGGGVMQDPLAPQLVVGSNGGDTLIGGSKDDWLVAGTGRQLLTGGAGADTFIFAKTGINAEISDFKVGLDRLQFEGLGRPPGPGGLQVINENGHAALLFGGDWISLLGVGVNQFRPSDVSFL